MEGSIDDAFRASHPRDIAGATGMVSLNEAHTLIERGIGLHVNHSTMQALTHRVFGTVAGPDGKMTAHGRVVAVIGLMRAYEFFDFSVVAREGSLGTYLLSSRLEAVSRSRPELVLELSGRVRENIEQGREFYVAGRGRVDEALREISDSPSGRYFYMLPELKTRLESAGVRLSSRGGKMLFADFGGERLTYRAVLVDGFFRNVDGRSFIDMDSLESMSGLPAGNLIRLLEMEVQSNGSSPVAKITGQHGRSFFFIRDGGINYEPLAKRLQGYARQAWGA